MLQRKALARPVPPRHSRETATSTREDVTHHDLADLALCRKSHADSKRGLTWRRRRRRQQEQRCLCGIYTTLPCAFSAPPGTEQAAVSKRLSSTAGWHQRRRIMCNYNRQSKTKPFTFNEFLLEKGRLPQGGILMKHRWLSAHRGRRRLSSFLQSANTASVRRRFTCLLTCSLCASECVCVRAQLLLIDTSHKLEGKTRKHRIKTDLTLCYL